MLRKGGEMWEVWGTGSSWGLLRPWERGVHGRPQDETICTNSEVTRYIPARGRRRIDQGGDDGEQDGRLPNPNPFNVLQQENEMMVFYVSSVHIV